MGSISAAANAAIVDGPRDNPTPVQKSELRYVFTLVDSSMSSAVNGLMVGNAVVYPSKSLLFADLLHGDGILGVVYNDATASNNGVYVKSGGSGTGSWLTTQLCGIEQI